MRTSIGIVDVIGKGVDRIGIIRIGVLHRNFDSYIIDDAFGIEGWLMQDVLIPIQMTHIADDTTLKVEVDLLVITLVTETEVQPLGQVGHFT